MICYSLVFSSINMEVVFSFLFFLSCPFNKQLLEFYHGKDYLLDWQNIAIVHPLRRLQQITVEYVPCNLPLKTFSVLHRLNLGTHYIHHYKTGKSVKKWTIGFLLIVNTHLYQIYRISYVFLFIMLFLSFTIFYTNHFGDFITKYMTICSKQRKNFKRILIWSTDRQLQPEVYYLFIKIYSYYKKTDTRRSTGRWNWYLGDQFSKQPCRAGQFLMVSTPGICRLCLSPSI